MASINDYNAILLYRIGPVFCCAPTLPVTAIIEPPQLTHPPGISASQPGIFKHARHIVSVFDLRFKFGLQQQDWKQPGRMIITELPQGHIGFMVDDIQEVMEMPMQGWGSLPAMCPKGIFSRTLLLNKKIHLYAEFERLLQLQGHAYLKKYIEHLVNEERRRIEAVIENTRNSHGDLRNARQTQSQTVVDSMTAATTTTSATRTVAATTAPVLTSASTTAGKAVHNSEPAHATVARHAATPAATQTSVTRGKPKSAAAHSHSKTSLGQRDTAAKSVQAADTHKQPSISTQKTAPHNEPLTLHTTTGQSGSHAAYMSQANPDHQSIADNSNATSHTQVTAHTLPADATSDSTTPVLLLMIAILIIGAVIYLFVSDILAPADNHRQAAQTLPTIAQPDNIQKDLPTFQTDTASSQQTQTTSSVSAADASLPETVAMIEENNDEEDEVPVATTVTADTTTAPNVPPINHPTANQQDDANPPASASTVDTATDAYRASSDKAETAQQSSDGDEIPATTTVTAKTTTAPDLPLTSNPAADKQDAATPPATTATADTATEAYRANIEKDASGITIVLDVPVTANVFKTDKDSKDSDNQSDSTQAQLASPEPLPARDTNVIDNEAAKDTDKADNVAVNKTDQRAEATVQSQEIIHIVVKGDTLWHIATRYLNNPYRYPELAKLSHIRNPDLIYPGDRVRIIKRTHAR